MRHSRDMAVKVALTYATLAIAWILGSDYVVRLLPRVLEDVAQSTKGILFVVVTAIILYILVERLSERLHQEAMSASSVERMLGQVVSSVPVGIVLTSDDGTVTFLNSAAESMVGLKSLDAIGHSMDEVCCADAPQSAAMLGELMRSGSVDEMAIGGRAGEQVRRVIARAAQIDPGLPASGWVIAFSDVTETQRAAVALQRTMGGYRFLAEALEVCVRASDPRTLLRRIAEVAVASGRYVAAWAVEGGGMPFDDVAMVGMGHRTKDIAQLMHQRVQEGGQMPRLLGTSADEGDVLVSNDLARDPANVWHPASLEDGFGSTAHLSVYTGGSMVGALTLFALEPGAFDSPEVEMLHTLLAEVSFTLSKLRLERKRLDAEQELEYSERGYRALFESHPAPMWIYDLDTLRFLAVNDAAVKKYGYRREEFLGMTIKDIRPPEDVPRLLANVTQERDGFEDSGIWTHVDKSGRAFPVHIYAHTIEWEGHQAELIMVLEVARME